MSPTGRFLCRLGWYLRSILLLIGYYLCMVMGSLFLGRRRHSLLKSECHQPSKSYIWKIRGLVDLGVGLAVGRVTNNDGG